MMSHRVFVDTSAWIAVINRSEGVHAQAVTVYKQLLAQNVLLVTTLSVLEETHILLRRRMGFHIAQKFLQSVNNSARIDVVFPTVEMELAAKDLLLKYADHDVSLTDAISWIVMKNLHIRKAFTFDRHFALCDFEVIPPMHA